MWEGKETANEFFEINELVLSEDIRDKHLISQYLEKLAFIVIVEILFELNKSIQFFPSSNKGYRT